MATIFILYHQWPLRYSLFSRHIFFYISVCILTWYIHVFNALNVPNILHLVAIFVFSHLILYVCIVWQWYLIFASTCDIFTAIHKNFTLGSHIFLSNLWSLMDSLFSRHIPFTLFMLISFGGCTHMCIYTK